MAGTTAVYLEVGTKRVFASAADWPGWSRSGKDEKTALENLAAYAPRYARVTALARIQLPKGATDFKVVERLKGNPTTDFGAPAVRAKGEEKPLTRPQAERMVALMDACWKYLDQVRAKAPQELRKGPRGGGRDRDKMWQHVLGAESAYASAIGVRLKEPDGQDAAAVKAFRKALREGFNSPEQDGKWPAPYAVRRTAWHALDHAWEMEDRIP
ncbi:MAG TPA: hypothetical protein VEU76_04795 [Candidatus Udaeobacter sp.]|nr:hypothetical protein [Candidatus Udaeobacter sp.]